MNFRQAAAMAKRLSALANVEGSSDEYSYVKYLLFIVQCHAQQAELAGYSDRSIDDPALQVQDERRHTRTYLRRLARAARVSRRYALPGALAPDMASFAGHPWVRP